MRYLPLLLLLLIPQCKKGGTPHLHRGVVKSEAKLEGKPRIDSLLNELNNAQEDTNKASLLGYLAFEYRIIDPDKGIQYGMQGLELATELSWKKGMAINYGHIGLNYKFKSDYPTALEYLFKSLKMNEEIGYKRGLGTNLSNIGVIYQEQANYTKALEFFAKSMKINEELKDSLNLAGDLGNIGIIYNLSSSDYDKALEYEFKSLKIFENLHNKDGIAHNLGNIGDTYNKQGNFTKSLEYDFKALEIFEELGDKCSIAINLGNIGETYLSIAKSAGTEPDRRSIGPSPKLNDAIEYLTKSIEVSKGIGDLESIIEFNKYLAEAYQLSGNYSAALEHYKEYATLKDSVYSTDNKVKIAKLESQREIEVKDKQIQLDKLEVRKRRNEGILLIIVTVLLLIIIGIGIRKYSVQRKSNKRLSKEKKRHLARIAAQKSVLSHIAHTQSHEVSGQVATILGLVEVFNFEDTTDPDNKVVIDGIAEVSKKLDKIVKEMVKKENDLNRYPNS